MRDAVLAAFVVRPDCSSSALEELVGSITINRNPRRAHDEDSAELAHCISAATAGCNLPEGSGVLVLVAISANITKVAVATTMWIHLRRAASDLPGQLPQVLVIIIGGKAFFNLANDADCRCVKCARGEVIAPA